MGALSPMHWAIIVIVVLLLFGSRKLPDLARGVGQSLRIFKAETSELRGDGDKGSGAQAPAVEKGGAPGESTTTESAASASPPASASPSAPGASAGSGTEERTDAGGTTGSGTEQRVTDSR